MGQLALSGEINQIVAKANSFEFRLSKPGVSITVTVNQTGDRATVKQIKLNVWGVLNSLHHLIGAPRRPANTQPASHMDLGPVHGRHQHWPAGAGFRRAMDVVSASGFARWG